MGGASFWVSGLANCNVRNSGVGGGVASAPPNVFICQKSIKIWANLLKIWAKMATNVV